MKPWTLMGLALFFGCSDDGSKGAVDGVADAIETSDGVDAIDTAETVDTEDEADTADGGDSAEDTGGGDVVTHTSGGVDNLDLKIPTIARVAVVDGEGDGALHALQAPVVDFTVVSPSVHLIGEQVAVLWSSGTVIYVCAGCITDYDMHMVLLDPASVAPVADPVVQRHDDNGLTDPRGVLIDGALLTTTALDFHALSFPATGVFRCDAR
jgi:hypothetical protein